MNKIIINFLIITVFVTAGLYFVPILLLCETYIFDTESCVKVNLYTNFYIDNIRGHLFAGFLAVGGFLLSLKTFIIITMKDNVYQNEQYVSHWINTNPSKKGIYDPLKDLSELLYFAILSSIVAAIMQLTIGLFGNWLASALSLGSTMFATALLIYSLIKIKKNLNTMFDYLETEPHTETSSNTGTKN